MQWKTQLNSTKLAALLFIAGLAHGSAATITGVSFSGTPLDPTITVSGSGFGAEPASSNLAYPGYTGFDYGTDLYFNDNSNNPNRFGVGEALNTGSDSVGLVVLSYTTTQIVYQFGSDYTSFYFPQDIYRLSQGDGFTAVVYGDSFSGTVNFLPNASSAPEPATYPLMLLGSAITVYLARRHSSPTNN